jgi:hypothetical protein
VMSLAGKLSLCGNGLSTVGPAGSLGSAFVTFPSLTTEVVNL